MPHVATWWCGQEAAREERSSRLDESRSSAYRPRRSRLSGPRRRARPRMSPRERERLRPAINDRGRLRRPGSGAPFDHAGVGRRPDQPPRSSCGSTRPPRRRADGHARRLLPHLRPAGRPRHLDGRGARAADVWVIAAGRWNDDALPAGDTVRIRRIPASAQPRRRQSVLARPLPGARRGHAAAGPGAWHAAARSRQGIVDLLHSVERIQRLLVAWGAPRRRRGRARRSPPKRCKTRRASARCCRWCARPSAPRPAA